MPTPQLSAQQKASLFAQATRQTKQMLPSQIVEAENTQIQFNLPKTRLLSKVVLEIEAVATLKSSAAAIPLKPMAPYHALRRISFDLNNGFQPYVVSGRDAYLYNTIRLNPNVLNVQTNKRGLAYAETAASVAGTDAKIKFQVQLPVTLNDRDPVGLVLLQNNETNVTVTVDVGALKDIYALNASNNDIVTFKSMTVTPLVETYSIPSVKEAFPDISVLKLVSAKADTFAGRGQSVVKLNVGTIYRKLILYVEDTNGVPFKDEDFNGNIELVFNQADIPYSMKPSLIAGGNHSELGFPLPEGVYVFDFSYQGIPNFGGARDYIDTERLTEFWVRFSSQKAGKMTVISETLSRLR